jgi:hypothetical protein
MHLNLLNPALRIDWPLLLAAVAVGITLLGAAAIALQIRRTRRRVMGTLERVFEQLDLMRLETLPANGAHAPPVQLPAVAQPPAPLATPRARPAPAELADYQGAARLAAHGAPMAENAVAWSQAKPACCWRCNAPRSNVHHETCARPRQWLRPSGLRLSVRSARHGEVCCECRHECLRAAQHHDAARARGDRTRARTQASP